MKLISIFLIVASFNSFAGFVAGSKINQCDRTDYVSPSDCRQAEGEVCYKVPNDSGECGIFKLKDLYGTIKFDQESCEGQEACQLLLTEKVCGVGRWPLIDQDYTEVYCVEVIGKEMVIDQALKAQKDAEKAAQAQIQALIDQGAKADADCKKVLHLIGGFNLQPGRTPSQTDSMVSTFAEAKKHLQDGRPGAAKAAIQAIPVDGVLVTQQMKDLALGLLSDWEPVE